MVDQTPNVQPPPARDAGEPIAEHRSRTRVTVDTVLRNRLAVVGLVVLAILVLAAIFGPSLAPYAVSYTHLRAHET